MATDDPFAELFGDVDLPEPRTWRDEVAAVVELEDETEAAEQLVRAIEAVFRDAPKLVTKPCIDLAMSSMISCLQAATPAATISSPNARSPFSCIGSRS